MFLHIQTNSELNLQSTYITHSLKTDKYLCNSCSLLSDIHLCQFIVIIGAFQKCIQQPNTRYVLQKQVKVKKKVVQ